MPTHARPRYRIYISFAQTEHVFRITLDYTALCGRPAYVQTPNVYGWGLWDGVIWHGHLSRYVKLRVAHAPGMLGTFSPPLRVSDPDKHHGTCVTHVPWYMPGSLSSGFLWNRWREKMFPAFPAYAQPACLRICWEVHALCGLECQVQTYLWLL